MVDRYVIEWETVSTNEIHRQSKGMDRYLWMRLGEIEIIGDVYRNPELLGAAE
ncbi:YopX family protein [Bacillus licheniformis]|nr:YopX family protein [Bacillus licheniformis]